MTKKLKSVRDIIDVFGSVDVLAIKADVGVKAVGHWRVANSIPPQHLPMITREMSRRGYEVDEKLWRFNRAPRKNQSIVELSNGR
jgi:predicted nuclease with RNAse H fold